MSETLLKYRQPTAPQDILTKAVPARLYTGGSGLNLVRAALFGVSLDKVKDVVELLKSYRGGRPNSLIGGGPLGWNWYSTLATMDTDHHGNMSGFGGTHHTHGQLDGVGIDDHHARDHAARHALGGADQLTLDASQIGSGNLGIARMPTGGNWDITADLTIETNALFIGRDGGSYPRRVGIGTATPSTKLHVRKQGLALLIEEDTSSEIGVANAGIQFNPRHIGGMSPSGITSYLTGADHSDLRFFVRDNGVTSEKMRIKSDGKVGIGTDSPQSKLGFPTATNEAGGITLGTGADRANLYRSAADVLKTDDNFDALALRIGATEVITSARALQNVTAATGIITSGRFGMARMPAGTSGQVLTGQGAGVDPAYAATPASGLAIFGDGSDGDVTISGNTTLTRDMFYNNLTVNAGITLNTGGYRVFVKETLTNNGVIARNGNAGTDASAGVSGTAGAALAAGSLGGSPIGMNGGNWYSCRQGGSGSGGGVVLIVAKTILNNGTISANGGAGGAGFAATGTAGTYAGAAGYNTTNTLGGAGGAGGATTSPSAVAGGAGGTVSEPVATEAGYRTLPFVITLRLLSAAGQISGAASGGTGGMCSHPTNPAVGGSAGGGGGLLILIYNSLATGTETASGGTGGAASVIGTGAAAAGADGSAGTVIKITNA